MTLCATFVPAFCAVCAKACTYCVHAIHFLDLSQDGQADLEDGATGAEAEPAGSCFPRIIT